MNKTETKQKDRNNNLRLVRGNVKLPDKSDNKTEQEKLAEQYKLLVAADKKLAEAEMEVKKCRQAYNDTVQRLMHSRNDWVDAGVRLQMQDWLSKIYSKLDWEAMRKTDDVLFLWLTVHLPSMLDSEVEITHEPAGHTARYNVHRVYKGVACLTGLLIILDVNPHASPAKYSSGVLVPKIKWRFMWQPGDESERFPSDADVAKALDRTGVAFKDLIQPFVKDAPHWIPALIMVRYAEEVGLLKS